MGNMLKQNLKNDRKSPENPTRSAHIYTQRANGGARAQVAKFTKFFAFKPCVKTTAEKL